MKCVGCGAPLPISDDIVRCSECGGFQVSSTNEHIHYCVRCGDNFTCWCTNENEMGDQRMCDKCGNQYRRLKDAHSFKSFKTIQRPNSWRR